MMSRISAAEASPVAKEALYFLFSSTGPRTREDLSFPQGGTSEKSEMLTSLLLPPFPGALGGHVGSNRSYWLIKTIVSWVLPLCWEG